ncbi:MAG: HEAT repeat domain-containing protein [Spirochaetes bacterium]|nr:HEAT repeat domain-containing protein [Spirochaetota bacterium]
MFNPCFAESYGEKELVRDLFSDDQKILNNALEYISVKKPQGILRDISSEILTSKDSNKKTAVLGIFKYYDYRATIPYCIKILKDSNSFIVKNEIIKYLSDSGSREVVPLIINELSSPFSTLRESAIIALKKIGDDRMFPYILNMMEDENPVFRVYALEAIYHVYDLRFYSHLIEMFKDKNKSIRYYVLRCIERHDLQEALRYVRNTAGDDESWEVRVRAIQVLESMYDKNSMHILLACLKDTHREIRYYSIKALKSLSFKASARPVSYGLYDESEDDIKMLMIDALISLKDAGGYKGLKKIISEDKNYRIRVFSAYSLGIIRKNYSELILLESIGDGTKEVRAEICNSLGYYKKKDVITRLLEVIGNDQERYVRSAALYSVLKIGGKFAISSLFDIYSIEKDPVFKEQVRFVLKKLIKEYT